MHAKMQPLVDRATELAERWKALAERWSTAELPTDTPHARLHSATFSEFSVRVMATLQMVVALGRVDEAGQLMFLPKVDTAIRHVKNARVSVDQLLSELNANAEAKFRDSSSGNLDALQGFVNGSHVANANAGSHLDQISANMAALFDLVSTGLRFGKAKGLSLYHTYGLQLQELVGVVKGLHDEMRALKDAALKRQVEVEGSAETVAEQAEAVTQVRGEATAALKAVQTAQSEADAKVATIRETSKAAAALAAQVEGYEAAFTAFQKSLDERVTQHGVFEQNMADALANNKAREDEIDRLIGKADSMIQGATTAGLGDSLEKTRKLYEKRMTGAGVGFFLAIVLLGVSAVPLVAHILPGLFTTWLPQATAGAVPSAANGDGLLGLLGKMFLLFPATWLTQFFSKAYSEFFHLEREYAHKAALARSVEGFKKQAPKYEEEITTAVFFEVQTNPSRHKAPDAAEHPIMGPLMKKFIDALPLGKSTEAGASK